MKLGKIVVCMSNYNFTKFHQNQMKTKKVLLIAPFLCSEFQSVTRIMKIVHSTKGYSQKGRVHVHSSELEFQDLTQFFL